MVQIVEMTALVLGGRVLALAGVLGLAACSRPEPPPPYNTAIDMHTLMVHVLDPAADAVWAASGHVVTEAGEEDLSPKTDEAWEAVETGAATVAEAGNLLMMPGRAPEGQPDWIRHAQAMTAAGLKAQKAAETRDKQGVFDTGGEIYQACLACHDQYVQGNPAATVADESGR